MTRNLILLVSISLPLIAYAQPQKDRAIVSEDFTKARPASRTRRARKQRAYRLTSIPLAEPLDKDSPATLKVGVTIWKIDRVYAGESIREVAKRVEAETPFHQDDLLRLSIESSRTGYLYVIDRDWFNDGSSGDTKLIFPLRGEDNRLVAGRLVDIPAPHRSPFRATPEANQAGEMLTIIITSAPLSLPLSNDPLAVSDTQLAEWERIWSGMTERFEMNDGVGQARTSRERQATSSNGSRQLTRDDPAPQTIYFISPRSSNGLLFNLLLHYVR